MRKVGKSKISWAGCMWCGFQTANAEQLAQHFQKEHKKDTIGGEYRPAKKAEDGRWECRECPEKFITMDGLEHHTLTDHQGKL